MERECKDIVMLTNGLQSRLVISNLTGPDKKVELSVVRDNQSVTSHVILGCPQFAIRCLGGTNMNILK